MRIILCNLSYFIIKVYQEITGIKEEGNVIYYILLLTTSGEGLREGGMFLAILLALWIPAAFQNIEGD